MTTRFSQTVFSPWLTPVRLASTSNIAGTYFNGPNNNGVGATLTIAASSLTVDSVVAAVGDRILLQTQTATAQQGIYIVKSIGSTVVLERAADQQSLEQLKAGEYVAVGAGSVNAGNFYTLVEPLPLNIGIDAMVFNADPSAGGVSFSGPASTANALAVFSDTAGNLKAASTTTTLGQALSITGALGVSGTIISSLSITSLSGDITSGSSGDAGSFVSFPATAANGTFIVKAVNAGAAFDTTLSNSTMGQSSVISFPDPGAATANVLLDTGTSNILAMQQFVGLKDILNFSAGTWTTTRIAQGNYVSRHTAAADTTIIGIDITPMIRTTASKGFRLDSFDVIYSIGTLALNAHTATLDRIAYANNVAVSITSVPITVTLATATQAQPYATNAAINTPAFDITADSKYIIEVTVNAAATSAYDFYGIMLKFSQTIG
jgi:hypothetical protein